MAMPLSGWPCMARCYKRWLRAIEAMFFGCQVPAYQREPNEAPSLNYELVYPHQLIVGFQGRTSASQ